MSKKKKKQNFLSKNYNLFIKSIKDINRKLAFMAFYDLVFISSTILFIYMTLVFIMKKTQSFDLTTPFLDLSQAQAEILARDVRLLFFFVIFTLIFAMLIIILNISVFKGLIWSIATKRKYNFKKFKNRYYLYFTKDKTGLDFRFRNL